MVRLPRIHPRKRCAPDDISGEQASESRLYAFSPETKEKLRKFRLGTSRANDPQAIICRAHMSVTKMLS